MSWLDFLLMLCHDYGAVGFVCGADFRFGHKGAGSAALLREYCQTEGLPCAIVPEQTMEGVRVSSTHIRNLLERGDVETAARFLGHPHILTGEVVPGHHLGRTLGTPTANLAAPDGLVKLPFGVYICRAKAEGIDCAAVTNIGIRPTVGGEQVTVEPWLLDFEGDLYGKQLTLEFQAFLRPEQKFASLEELKAQIQKDAAKTRALLG
jgi:riboflavin kinase/FMN adenylyltransferase